MLNTLNDVLNNVDNFIWGMPLIILILFTGILLTVRLRGLQIRHLGKALHYVFHNEDDGEGEVTSFGALCTALSAHYTKTLVFLWHTYVIFSIQYFYQFLCFFPATVLN